MTNEKLKNLQTIVQTDKLIIEELKNLLSSKSTTLEQLRTLQDKLKYEKANTILDSIKQNLFIGSNLSDVNKIKKLETDIDRLRHEEFSISMFISSQYKGKFVKKLVTSVITKILPKTWKVPDISLVNPDFQAGLKAISKERIPVILDKESVIDLTKMPHLLVAGKSGSGKSVFLNVLITTILYKMNPNNCKLVLIDPKRVEFSSFKDIPHLWKPVATQMEQIEQVLNDLVTEMEKRFVDLEKVNVKSIESYNQKVKEKLPYIVVIIDELADLTMVSNHGVETQITRLAQLARAVGIHIVMATQKPVAKILEGLIKANTSKIAFKVASRIDSHIILDESGAELLKGNGVLLYKSDDGLEKHQGIFVSEEEIKQVIS